MRTTATYSWQPPDLQPYSEKSRIASSDWFCSCIRSVNFQFATREVAVSCLSDREHMHERGCLSQKTLLPQFRHVLHSLCSWGPNERLCGFGSGRSCTRDWRIGNRHQAVHFAAHSSPARLSLSHARDPLNNDLPCLAVRCDQHARVTLQ